VTYPAKLRTGGTALSPERTIEIPNDYVRGERALMARAVLIAMEPGIQIAEAVEAESVAAPSEQFGLREARRPCISGHVPTKTRSPPIRRRD
jgi:hypothetical protein